MLLTDQEDPRHDGPRAFGAFNGERISWNTAGVDVMPVIPIDDHWANRRAAEIVLAAHNAVHLLALENWLAHVDEALVRIAFGFYFGEDEEP